MVFDGESTHGERSRPVWGSLYAVIVVGVVLCLAGYHLEKAIGHAKLVQSAVIGIVLSLLFAWTRVHRSALLTRTRGAQDTPRPHFSIIRVSLLRRPRAVGRQPNGWSAARRGQASNPRVAAHTPLR